jgi:hypothetical protein
MRDSLERESSLQVPPGDEIPDSDDVINPTFQQSTVAVDGLASADKGPEEGLESTREKLPRRGDTEEPSGPAELLTESTQASNRNSRAIQKRRLTSTQAIAEAIEKLLSRSGGKDLQNG